MALKAAGKPATNASDERPEVPDEIPRGRSGRPNIRALRADGTDDPAKLISYTRASTLGKALEDQTGLDIWRKRMVTWGLGRDKALVLAAASVATTTEDTDKGELDRIAEEALTIARASSGATRGTALHKLSEQRDAGTNLSHLPTDAAAALDAYSRLMAGFEVVASETFVVCDALETAGSFDRLVSPRWAMEAPDGSTIEPGDRLILDLKTNKDAKYFGPTYACQQAVYAYGVPYSHRDGRGSWPLAPKHERGYEDHSAPPSRQWALILHVPIESVADAGLHWVDLQEGYELAELARTVRAQRGRKDLFYPAEPPREARPAAIDAAGLMALIHAAESVDALGDLYERYEHVWTDRESVEAEERAAELERAA